MLFFGHLGCQLVQARAMSENKEVALVTGGSRGIGRAIAEELGKAGYHLILLAEHAENLEKAKREIAASTHATVDTLVCDVTNPNDIDRVFAWFKKKEMGIDALVHSAGIFIDPCGLDASPEVFDRTLGVNLRAIYYINRMFKPLLLGRNKPRVVIIGSTAGLATYTMGSMYSVGKWGLHGYAVNLRAEWMQDGIGVILVNPGSTITDLWGDTEHPRERFVQPEDIGKVVRACLSLSKGAVVDEVIVRPLLGDLH
jgi:3-oxoacyl-[acyl-carrier protein] reductase